MHAWVRAWCGWQAGWIEYDPTNAIVAGTDHILVARGRDYGDVAPVKGVLRIAGEQKTEHAVDVVPVLALRAVGGILLQGPARFVRRQIGAAACPSRRGALAAQAR